MTRSVIGSGFPRVRPPPAHDACDVPFRLRPVAPTCEDREACMMPGPSICDRRVTLRSLLSYSPTARILSLRPTRSEDAPHVVPAKPRLTHCRRCSGRHVPGGSAGHQCRRSQHQQGNHDHQAEATGRFRDRGRPHSAGNPQRLQAFHRTAQEWRPAGSGVLFRTDSRREGIRRASTFLAIQRRWQDVGAS